MPEYDFRTLSSHDLELLVRDLLQAEMGVIFDSFKPGRDGGIDLRHCSSEDQKIIVQVKHYVESGYSPLYRDLENSELPKVRRLNPSIYIIVTSVPLSPNQMDDMTALFQSACTDSVITYGKEGLNNLIARYPEIERKHYKLWLTSSAVLDRLLHNDIYNRTACSLEEITQKMRLYVEHDGFEKALNILEEKYVCIISGQPGIGKTTLAEMLLAKYIADGYEVRVLGDINEAFRADSPDVESRIVFFYDDFLGQAQLREQGQTNEDSTLLGFIGNVRRKTNRRFILTTREYILQEALQKRERLSNAELEVSKLVLDLAHYTRESKAHILFNHLYFSKLPRSYKKGLLRDNAIIKIIDHPNYNPRIIDWMTKPIKSTEYEPEQYAQGFLDTLKSQIPVWKNAFDNYVSADCKVLLYILYSLGESAEIKDLEKCFKCHIAEGSPLEESEIQRKFKDAVHYLDGSFISFRKDWGRLICSFYNPSIREFVAGRFINNISLVQQILRHAIFFNQCESMLPFCVNVGSTKQAARQLQRELMEAIPRTLKNYISIGRSVSKERRAVQAMKMAASFSSEEEQKIILYVINWVTGLTTSRTINATDSENLIRYAQSRLLDPLIKNLGDTILYSPSKIDEFEDAVDFVEKYGDTSLFKVDEEQMREAFERFYDNLSVENLNVAEPEEYRSMARDLDYSATSFKFDVRDKVKELLSAADALEREYERQEEELNPTPPITSTPKEQISNQEILSIFGTLPFGEESE